MLPDSNEWFFAGAGRRVTRTKSGNLSKDMPDQPFLCFMDVFQQRGFVHAHLLCQFTGVNPPGMIEKSRSIRFQQDLFLFWSEDVKNPVDMGIVIADREDPESNRKHRDFLGRARLQFKRNTTLWLSQLFHQYSDNAFKLR